MIKFAYAILPYKELIDITKQFSSEHDIDVLPDEKNAESAIPAALSAEKNGAKIIISRGGTAEIIKKHVHIPVVDIRVSDLDILQVLYPMRELNKKILIAGYRNAVARCRSIAEILGLDTHELLIPYEKEEYNFDRIKYDARKIIDHYGIDTIVGDQTAFVNLQSFCQNLHLIKSGREDVIEAIEKTETTLASRFGRSNNIPYVKNVLDSVNDAVISADDQGIITIFNSRAEKMFNHKKEDAIGRKIDKLLNRKEGMGNLKSAIANVLQSGESIIERIHNPENSSYVINTSPILTGNKAIGVVLAISETQDNINTAQKPVKKNLYQGFSTRYTLNDILTVDESFKKKVQIAAEYARSDATVLIEGESGTGKELFAQGIHSASSRKDAPFVAVNCAAIPAQLLESELFGYVDGAFTDAAKKGKRGLFELADTGTIFLDEISEIDKSLQVKFLRVLEEKQIMRIGSDSSFPIDVRVIAATNGNLKSQVLADRFRSDLYYRLNLLNLRIPALREHKADIEYLASHFFKLFSRQYKIRINTLSPEIMELLKKYSWPGNIRELKNIMERIVLTVSSSGMDASLISLIAGDLCENIDCPSSQLTKMTDIKYNAAIDVLKEENFNKSRAARKLGIDRSTLDRILKAGTHADR